MKVSISLLTASFGIQARAWLLQRPSLAGKQHYNSALDMAAVGIFYGTSTGSTQDVANAIYETFGSDVAAEPVDIETLGNEGSSLAQAFGQHGALVVGTPTWNTGADTERSGTGWDELYYNQLPAIQQVLKGKNVAVFGLGDQESYSENFADATGELFDVFEGLGCRMMGAWSQQGYEHDASKSIRGDKFCGLVLDMVNQEDLTEERVNKWVAQLIGEGILEGASASSTSPDDINGIPDPVAAKTEQDELKEHSDLLDKSIESHSSGGFTPHHNPRKGTTMWTSADGRSSFVTELAKPETEQSTKMSP